MSIAIVIVPGGQAPTRATPEAAGLDLYAREARRLRAGSGTARVPVGICIGIPPGYFGFIVGRSGLAARGILAHSGVIDQDYRGEISAILHNTGEEDLPIEIGDRVAQLVITPYLHGPAVTLVVVPDFGQEKTARGALGFGSSGR